MTGLCFIGYTLQIALIFCRCSIASGLPYFVWIFAARLALAPVEVRVKVRPDLMNFGRFLGAMKA